MKGKNKIDQLIKKALEEEEKVFYKELGEQRVPNNLIRIFNKKSKRNIISKFVIIIFWSSLGILCGIQFLMSYETKKLILWASGFFLCASVVIVMKIKDLIQKAKNDLLRELKLMELQISMLNKKPTSN